MNIFEGFMMTANIEIIKRNNMITYTTGNLFDNNATALLNTVNTVGVMGKGIAFQFKQAFPHNFKIYKKACRDGKFAIGQLLTIWDSNLLYGERLIINLPTKTHWRLSAEYTYGKRTNCA
jgi:O-acetyl-ADP-ribose deacetylase (regulator of RNase III)